MRCIAGAQSFCRWVGGFVEERPNTSADQIIRIRVREVILMVNARATRVFQQTYDRNLQAREPKDQSKQRSEESNALHKQECLNLADRLLKRLVLHKTRHVKITMMMMDALSVVGNKELLCDDQEEGDGQCWPKA